jgi:hypothetical protein
MMITFRYLRRITEDVTVAYYKAMYMLSNEETEENHENVQSR